MSKITEKQKAAKGILYNANYDKEIITERLNCQELCYEYNLLKPSDLTERNKLIKAIIKKTGQNFMIEQPFRCDFGYRINMGDNFYSNYNLIILDGAEVTFGDNVFIGPNCGIYAAGHPYSTKLRKEGLEYAWPITIGNDVWIGGNVSIMGGVTIGAGTVIGAGSVVTKDIPGNVLAAGNPCRVIREITEQDDLKYMKEFKK